MNAERLPPDRSNDVELRGQLTDLLFKQIVKYAAVILGNRVGSDPDTSPEDLAIRAIVDTMDGTRNWKPEKASLKTHLRGCVKSYISHYFDSRKGHGGECLLDGRTSSQESCYSNDDSVPNGNETRLVDYATPEEFVMAQETLDEIDSLVLEQGEPRLIRMWELVWKEHLNLKDDRVELCKGLDLDPAVGGPDYQKFIRLRNRLKKVAESVVVDVPLSRGKQALSNGPIPRQLHQFTSDRIVR